MTVGPDLLKAAEANDHDAIDMVSIWGLGFEAEIGGSLAPGMWMHGGAQRVLQHCAPGVLFSDLSACNSYQDALAAGAKVAVPTTLILGEKDMMTPAKAGKALASAIPQARTVVLRGRGPHDDGGAAGRTAGGAESLIFDRHGCRVMICQKGDRDGGNQSPPRRRGAAERAQDGRPVQDARPRHRPRVHAGRLRHPGQIC